MQAERPTRIRWLIFALACATSWLPLSIRPSVQGVVTACGRLGGACSPLILATLLMGLCGLSWQFSLVVIALPGILLAIVLWIVIRNSPAEHPWTNHAESALIGE